jgi:protein ImuB
MYHHRIPCYGDLTPGIPDVTNAAKSLAAFGDNSQLPTPNKQTRHTESAGSPVEESALSRWELGVGSWELRVGSEALGVGSLYACLRLNAGSGELATVLAVARDFSPRVMAASEREVLVDISGLGRLIGPPDEIARQLAHAMFDAGLTANVAIGPTQTIARVLAHGAETGHGLTLRLLPVELLRGLETLPPAMNERDRLRPYETLQRWGIERLGDLAALPAPDLSSRLGRRGVTLQRLARGLDLRPFVPDRETTRFIESLELEWPIDSLEPLSFVLARLLEPLSHALERADRGAVAIRLELRLTDRSTFTRVLPLPAPMRDARVLRTLLTLALESNPPPAAIDVVSIELDPAPARIVRFSLFDRALPSPETLATLTARLSALVGESRVGAAALVDSHAPDAFAMTRYAPDEAAGVERPDGADAERADRVDRVDRESAVLRRQRTPVALRVSCEQRRPVHMAASRRGIPYGGITEAAGPWRTSGGWWTTPGAGGLGLGQGAGRGEPGAGWDVALKSGAVCRIYRDRSTERWFLEGIYD